MTKDIRLGSQLLDASTPGKRPPHFVLSSETGPPSSFAIKFEARRGPVKILVAGSQEGVVA